MKKDNTPKPDKTPLPKDTADLDVCTQAPEFAEHARPNEPPMEPCDDGRAGIATSDKKRKKGIDMTSLKDKLIKDIDSRINAWEKKIEAEKADAEKKQSKAESEKAEAELKKQMTENVNALRSKIDTAQKKIKEVQESGAQQLENLKNQVDSWLS